MFKYLYIYFFLNLDEKKVYNLKAKLKERIDIIIRTKTLKNGYQSNCWVLKIVV